MALQSRQDNPLRFGSEVVWKIFSKRMNQCVSSSVNGLCWTALVTAGLVFKVVNTFLLTFKKKILDGRPR